MTCEHHELQKQTFVQFVNNLVGFREGKQSSCRGSWTSKEYSEVRLMLRYIPKTKAYEM
jgi:hypothetical protein